MNTLPDKPSELILCALADLEKCEALPEIYEINMGCWHASHGDGRCSVCLVGAVMAQTFQVSPMSDACADYASLTSDCDKLHALDYIRRGSLRGAATVYRPMEVLLTAWNVPEYKINPEGFKSQIRKIAEAYAAIGA